MFIIMNTNLLLFCCTLQLLHEINYSLFPIIIDIKSKTQKSNFFMKRLQALFLTLKFCIFSHLPKAFISRHHLIFYVLHFNATEWIPWCCLYIIALQLEKQRLCLSSFLMNVTWHSGSFNVFTSTGESFKVENYFNLILVFTTCCFYSLLMKLKPLELKLKSQVGVLVLLWIPVS